MTLTPISLSILHLYQILLFSTDCGPLDNPSGGSVSFSTTKYESEATYSCNPGYSLNGTAMRVCQDDATWSDDEPSCQIKGFFIHKSHS